MDPDQGWAKSSRASNGGVPAEKEAVSWNTEQATPDLPQYSSPIVNRWDETHDGTGQPNRKRRGVKWVIWIAVVAVLAIGIGLGVGLGVGMKPDRYMAS